MAKHLYCKHCECKVGVVCERGEGGNNQTKVSCFNCGEVIKVVSHRVSAQKSKANATLQWLLDA